MPFYMWIIFLGFLVIIAGILCVAFGRDEDSEFSMGIGAALFICGIILILVSVPGVVIEDQYERDNSLENELAKKYPSLHFSGVSSHQEKVWFYKNDGKIYCIAPLRHSNSIIIRKNLELCREVKKVHK